MVTALISILASILLMVGAGAALPLIGNHKDLEKIGVGLGVIVGNWVLGTIAATGLMVAFEEHYLFLQAVAVVGSVVGAVVGIAQISEIATWFAEEPDKPTPPETLLTQSALAAPDPYVPVEVPNILDSSMATATVLY